MSGNIARVTPLWDGVNDAGRLDARSVTISGRRMPTRSHCLPEQADGAELDLGDEVDQGHGNERWL